MTASMQGTEPPIWLRLPAVAGIVTILAVLKLAVASHTGLSFDEGYYTLWSRRLAAGYFDHPPAVAFLIAAGRSLLGDGVPGVRILAILCGTGICAALWRVGVLLLDRRAAALAVLFYALSPASGLGFLMTPDPPSALFWVATIWAVAEVATSGRGRWWVPVGIFAGLGLCSKYTDAFIAPGILLFVLFTGSERRWLKRWEFWSAGFVAALIFAPVFWWNAQHDWASFLFQGQRTEGSIDPNASGNLTELLAGQSLFMGPLLVVLAVGGMVGFAFMARRPGWSGLGLPVWTTLPGIVYFLWHTLHARVEANWLIPLWPPLCLVAAWLLLALWRRKTWLGVGLFALQALFGVTLTGAIYAQALWQPWDFGGADRTNETRGWPELQRELSAAAAANGAHWIATAGSFALTGELSTYFAFANDPLPVRQVDEPMRWDFLPPLDGDALGWPALFVTTTPDAAARLFGQSRQVGAVTRLGGRDRLETYALFLVSDPTSAFNTALGK